MKKLTFLMTGLLVSGLAMAQPLANHLYLGGSLGFQTEKTTSTQGNIKVDYPKTTQYNFSPAIGYTLTDNWLLGVRAGIGGSKTTDLNPITNEEIISRTTIGGAEIFGRYYFNLSERFFFYPDLGIGFASSSSEEEEDGVTETGPETNIFQIGVTPGFAYYPTTHWGIELSVGFVGFTSVTSTDERPDPNTETQTNGFDFVLNMASVNVGISYLLML
ncbi:MAG TPA: hypothetical protein DCG19_11530 [Cryomorphaceae bacterium]|nr:hypothetical protein [Owenweeksia sp.]MBF97934.1 hypothetical protein [Owenweeksia sp.]HAD98029.1 hypothetical protein [Cryomorphaceae bacterium]HBF20894.1 hypothetical protein [Cryomorphaceae bacterium]HCQ15271.1 hypothetical protein [Cryomorphaceae bacterium]|tara:strand:- start:5280 stop:5930 length:651 start_codon:yes stop_codon:yes gene_type:complete